MDIKALSEYLGHASAVFTLAVYAHLMPSATDKLRAAIDHVLGGAADGPDSAQGVL